MLRTLLVVSYWSMFLWWNEYIKTCPAPGSFIGALVALFGSIYLIHFMLLASFDYIAGPVIDAFEKNLESKNGRLGS